MMNSLKSAVLTSWKTTVLGILAGLALIIPEGIAILDSNPETVLNVEQLIAGLSLIGLGTAARSNGITSEKVGAAEKDE